MTFQNPLKKLDTLDMKTQGARTSVRVKWIGKKLTPEGQCPTTGMFS